MDVLFAQRGTFLVGFSAFFARVRLGRTFPADILTVRLVTEGLRLDVEMNLHDVDGTFGLAQQGR